MLDQETENLFKKVYLKPADIQAKITKLMKEKMALQPVLSKPSSRNRAKEQKM